MCFLRFDSGGPHVIRTAMVAAVMPSKTSSMNSARVCIREPDSSNGTSPGRTACRKLCSWGLVWTNLAV